MSDQVERWIGNAAGGPNSDELNRLGQDHWELMRVEWDSEPRRERFLTWFRRSPHQWKYVTSIYPNRDDIDLRTMGYELASQDPQLHTAFSVHGYIGVYKRTWRYE